LAITRAPRLARPRRRRLRRLGAGLFLAKRGIRGGWGGCGKNDQWGFAQIVKVPPEYPYRSKLEVWLLDPLGFLGQRRC